jgi:hypothetical protein
VVLACEIARIPSERTPTAYGRIPDPFMNDEGPDDKRVGSFTCLAEAEGFEPSMGVKPKPH